MVDVYGDWEIPLNRNQPLIATGREGRAAVVKHGEKLVSALHWIKYVEAGITEDYNWAKK